MGAFGISPWVLWALIGMGPVAVGIGFGMRALARDTGAAWADSGDINTLLDWTMPGLAVLAVMPLTRLHLTTPMLGLCAAAPVIAYLTYRAVVTGLSKTYRKAELPVLSSIRLFAAAEGFMIGSAVFLFLRAVIEPSSLGRTPTASLFIAMYFAGRAGGWAFAWLAPKIGEWKILAPSDLYRRVIEIAARYDVKADEVRVLEGLPWDFVNAMAYSEDSIGFSHDLIAKLRKDEVDAIVAHEVGHLTDSVYWRWSYPTLIILVVAWLGAVKYLERSIGALPAQYHSLQYANWLAMFVLPGLVWHTYSRYCERRADSKVVVIDNPQMAISGYYKLYRLDDTPIGRPLWSRALCTHPEPRERIAAIARNAGLSDEQVRATQDRAEAEMADNSGEHYEMVFHEESGLEIEKRGREAVDVAVILGAVLAGGLVLSGSFFLILNRGLEGWPIALAIIGTFVAAGLVIALPIDAYQKSKNNRLRSRMRNKLALRHGDEAASSLLLVDARLNQDEDVWQAAWIGVRDGSLVVLAESREVAVPLGCELSVERFTHHGHVLDDTTMVAIRYNVDSVGQWIIIRDLGRPEKGLPRGQKGLERHVRDLITGAGGTIRARPKPPLRQVLVRAPIAVVALAAVVGLTEIVTRLAGFEAQYIIHGLVISGVGTALYPWVTKTPSRDESDTQL